MRADISNRAPPNEPCDSARPSKLVAARAQYCCEYCLLHQDDGLLSHEVDHIIASQHGGASMAENLGYACFDCNRLKGPNLASMDPLRGRPAFLFSPRKDPWTVHFRLTAARIVPLTEAGRATAALLLFNEPGRVARREALIRAGAYPRISFGPGGGR